MEIQKIYPVTQYMLLGRCGDNNVKQIWINVRQWLQEVPSGQFQLMIYPPQGDVYPAPTVLEDGILKWTITDADTAIVGDGQAQLTMYGADGEVERQKTIGTRVLESKAGRESGEIPDHITPWVDTISTMSTQAKRAAAQAKASQSIVQEYSQQAQAAVGDAVAAKNSAEASKVAAESARDSAQNYVADAQAAKATAQAAASEAQDAKYAAQSAKTLAEGAKSQAIGAKLEAQYAQQHAVAAKDAAVQAQLSAQGYATTAQTAASSANTANSQAQSAKTDAVQAKQAAQEALQQLKDGIRTGDFKGEKGDTPVITSERSGNVTTIRSNGVAVAQILDGQDGDAGFSPSVSVTKNNKVTTIRITDKDGVHTATINDGEDGSDATVTKQSIEAALSYVPANDATAMVYKQVIFDGTKFTDDAGTQLTFSQLKTLCLDHKHFVYCTYENDLYIPQHVQPTQIYFDATYIRNHQVEIHRVGINLNGSVNQQVVYPQEKLVSGTNIKTINNESILGSGDIHIVGGGDIVQNPDDEYEGIVVPSTLADVDPTLTVHGDAADAGVVGQRIGQIDNNYLALRDDVDDLESGKADKSSVYTKTESDAKYLTSHQDISGLMPKEQLMDAGIKSITWATNVNSTFTTVEDPLKAQRPAGTATRYWVEMPTCPYFYHSKMYRVTFNGTVYNNLECRYGILIDETKGSVIGSDTTTGGAWQMIGNRYLYDSRYIDTGQPFAILYVEHGGMHDGGGYYYSSTVGHGILLTRSAQTATIKIETATITKNDLPHCLDEDFGAGDKLLQTTNSTYPRSSWGQGNIVGRGSFAIGNGNIATGQFSLAEGRANVATGHCSHAEGTYTKVTGIRAHAEGCLTEATGQAAHAEGFLSQATGQASHAEGVYVGPNNSPTAVTVASAYGSHAEGGGTTASGLLSHSENRETEAAALGSHAQGYGTYAGSQYQHTQGKFNVKDTSKKYAHIVGNGTSNTARSNAHTLDWNGNAWFQGKVESASGVLKLGNTEFTEAQLAAVSDRNANVTNALTASDRITLNDAQKATARSVFGIHTMTQEEYDLITPVESDIYIIVGADV